ncbi:Transfer protein traSA [Microbacterium esteraromaticum]|uniref:Transfer protein traSA n=1 Tax=Microbacterium esteraromaticum TaxID=57043 RepID=A0A1R4JY02_9MICO|nr:Transfer protein traSA [Microbacterium esteraromaticum]
MRGYLVARDLGLIPRADDEEALLRRPHRLPVVDFTRNDADARLEVEQQSAIATDNTILNRAVAYAPTISMSSEFVSVSRPSPGAVTVTWLAEAPEDPLREPVTFRPFPLSDPAAPACIGVTENGDSFRLQVFNRQTLLLGATGSGKSSILWSTLAQMAPYIHTGLISAHAIDLKGGVEAEPGRKLFREVAYDYGAAQAMIARLADRMTTRLAYMRESGLRKHIPTTAEPLELLVIDEAAALAYSAPDRKSAEQLNANLKLMLSQGRAAGYAILAALQDPRKESLATRDLYSQTVALRFRTRDDAILALGTSAYEAGAHAERIAQSQPGTGYVIDGDSGDLVRFRAFWIEDEVIRHIAQTYAAPSEVAAKK